MGGLDGNRQGLQSLVNYRSVPLDKYFILVIFKFKYIIMYMKNIVESLVKGLGLDAKN